MLTKRGKPFNLKLEMKLLKISFLLFLSFLIVSQSVSAYVDPGEDSGGGSGRIDSYEKAVFEQKDQFNLQSSVRETYLDWLTAGSESILGGKSALAQAVNRGGAAGGLATLITGMYAHPPVSSVEYFADLGRHLGIVKPAYAQGIGFQGLKPILPLWKIFRDIAYLFFVVVFIIVGFAIMFRVKINPQTVISIENALPGIVLALILVTFSYAIAGLLVDLIYVSIDLIFSLMYIAPNSPAIDISQNIFSLGSKIFTNWTTVATNVGSQMQTLTRDLLSGLGGTVLGFGVGVVATAVVALAILYSLFKIFFTLLMSYVSIIVGVIFSPIMLMLQALPGQNGFSNWLKTMLTNIIPFPVTAVIFSIASIMVKGASSTPGEIWVAPFLGGGSSDAYIPTLIGVGMILLTPSIIDSVKKSIGAPGIAGMAGGIGGPLGTSVGALSYPVKLGAQARATRVQERGPVLRARGGPNIAQRAEETFWNVMRTGGKVK